MIHVCNISKVFNAGGVNEFAALREVSLEVQLHRGTILKGPSGAGKTTMLGIIGCMLRPTAGRVFLGDREITSLPQRFLSGIRRDSFGFVFQHFNLIKGLSVLENVMVPAYPRGEKFHILKKRALDTLAMFNLEQRADARVEWLSGGEAQRVAIARALINNPSFIIADEPTAHLDSGLSLEFIQVMCRLRECGKTIVIASHDPVVYESELADVVVEMRDGRIVDGDRP